ncbi:MAG: hypothetical protein PVI28_18380 [Gammaproteobacteria bacterium]|jgi:hypothetical protein
MLRRRAFLVFLTSCLGALLTTARARAPVSRAPGIGLHRPELILHKGWILREDDPK